MKLTALMLCRNSDWVLGLSLRAALVWCDSVVVLMHNCTDDTERIILDVSMEFAPKTLDSPSRIWVIEDCHASWEEMRLRQAMLTAARQWRSTHIALIDDDEVLSGNLLPTIRAHVERTPPGTILQLPWLCLRDGIDKVMVTGQWGEAEVSSAFVDDPVYHWAAQDGYDHHHRHPMGRQFAPYRGVNECQGRAGGLMHLQFSSRKRLLAKQYWYQLVERIRWPNREMPGYSRTVLESKRAKVSQVPSGWWQPYEHLLQYLRVDAEPWQLAECRRMIAENPGIERGLDDFGLNL